MREKKVFFLKPLLATFLLIAAISGASYWHDAFAEEKKKSQQDWSAAEKLFETKCKLCHSIDRPKKAKKTYKEWKSTVMRMKSYAPVITDEQAEQIIEYLSHHYGR